MSQEYSGYCRNCEKHFEVPSSIDDGKKLLFAKCPACRVTLQLTHKSLKSSIRELRLGTTEIGIGQALISTTLS